MTAVDAARVATVDDAGVVTEVLVAAFYDDPTWSWAFPDPASRRSRHREFWRVFVDGALRYPWVWLSPGNRSTSLWIPPGETEMSDAQESLLESLVVDLLGADADRVLRALELFHDAHPTAVPHYYLSLLATDPAHSGHGYGLRLLADNLALIDEQGAPAYLEASNPANVPLYERYGFHVVGSFDLPEGGPRVDTMWRDPRGG